MGALLCSEVRFPCIFCIAWPTSTEHHASIFGCQITRKSIKVTAGPRGLPQARLALSLGCRKTRRGALDLHPTVLLFCPIWGSLRNPPTAKQPNVEALRWVGFHFNFCFLPLGDWRTAGSLGGEPGAAGSLVRPAGTERGAAPGGGARGLRVAAGGGGFPPRRALHPASEPAPCPTLAIPAENNVVGQGGEGPRPKARL